jgi:crotonobetainyl-CoA:carnitine CoA-transferase CaiB-like acyl-CoA transferase
MKIDVKLPSGGAVNQPGNPVKLSRNSTESFSTPPMVGQHTSAVLREILNLDDAALDGRIRSGTVGL